MSLWTLLAPLSLFLVIILGWPKFSLRSTFKYFLKIGMKTLVDADNNEGEWTVKTIAISLETPK